MRDAAAAAAAFLRKSSYVLYIATFLCSYDLLVDALLIKEEFQETLDRIKTALDAIIISAQGLRQFCLSSC
jgi:hypothetical protein